MKLASYVAVSFITFFKFFWFSILCRCMYGCVLCILLFNFLNYVSLFLCLCILVVMIMYSYCYVCFVLGILSHFFVSCIVYV